MDSGPDDRAVRGNVLLRPARLVIETESAISQLHITPVRDLDADGAEHLPAQVGAGAETADVAVEIQEHRARNIVTAAQAENWIRPGLRAAGIHARVRVQPTRPQNDLAVEIVDS